MATISFEFEPSTFGALRLAPSEFAREMRIAAAVQWYAQGIVSQGKAAEARPVSEVYSRSLRLFRRKVGNPG